MINKYPDGTSYAAVSPQKEFTFKVNSYEDLWYLNQVIDAQNSLDIIPTVTIPCLIDAQADKRFASNQSNGLKLVCKFLNQMNARFKIFHPHNPEVVEALIDGVEIIDNTNFIFNVLDVINNRNYANLSYDINDSNLILMSSDAGGFKPLMKLCDKIGWQGETASASKSREYKNGKSILTQLIAHNDFRGKDILIVDDICIYGGTFKGLAKLLRERNCGKLYLAVSHIMVQNLGEDPVTNYFDKVFTTNSKFNIYRAEKNGTFTPNNLDVIQLFN